MSNCVPTRVAPAMRGMVACWTITLPASRRAIEHAHAQPFERKSPHAAVQPWLVQPWLVQPWFLTPPVTLTRRTQSPHVAPYAACLTP